MGDQLWSAPCSNYVRLSRLSRLSQGHEKCDQMWPDVTRCDKMWQESKHICNIRKQTSQAQKAVELFWIWNMLKHVETCWNMLKQSAIYCSSLYPLASVRSRLHLGHHRSEPTRPELLKGSWQLANGCKQQTFHGIPWEHAVQHISISLQTSSNTVGSCTVSN